jgi:hypothetical protein
MPITLDWGNFEETFAVWKFEMFWTWDEMYVALATLRKMFGEKNTPCHIVVDTRRCMMPSSGLISNIQNVPRYMPTNVDVIVVIASHNLLFSLNQTLKRIGILFPGKIIFVETVDAAYNLVDTEEDV